MIALVKVEITTNLARWSEKMMKLAREIQDRSDLTSRHITRPSVQLTRRETARSGIRTKFDSLCSWRHEQDRHEWHAHYYEMSHHFSAVIVKEETNIADPGGAPVRSKESTFVVYILKTTTRSLTMETLKRPTNLVAGGPRWCRTWGGYIQTYRQAGVCLFGVEVQPRVSLKHNHSCITKLSLMLTGR